MVHDAVHDNGLEYLSGHSSSLECLRLGFKFRAQPFMMACSNIFSVELRQANVCNMWLKKSGFHPKVCASRESNSGPNDGNVGFYH